MQALLPRESLNVSTGQSSQELKSRELLTRWRPGTHTHAPRFSPPTAVVVVPSGHSLQTCGCAGCAGASVYLPSGQAAQIVALVAGSRPAFEVYWYLSFKACNSGLTVTQLFGHPLLNLNGRDTWRLRGRERIFAYMRQPVWRLPSVGTRFWISPGHREEAFTPAAGDTHAIACNNPTASGCSSRSALVTGHIGPD